MLIKKKMNTVNSNSDFSKKTLLDYEVLSVLGSGSFGTCYKVRDKETNKFYAWKAIDYDELDEIKLESLISEINVLRQLKHPNIVLYYHNLNSSDAKSIFIITEWCENGDLSHLIMKARLEQKRLQERYIWRLLFQICKALQVCHSKLKQGTLLHRDIKPENIFLDANWNAKLGDFGLARLLQSNERFAKSFVGTPHYMSPEIIKNESYNAKSDVWALGCLIYETAALKKPFKGRMIKQLTANITAGNYNKISTIYSQDLQQIISFMLELSEEQRPCIEMIVRHPNVVRNIISLELFIEPLVEAEQEFYTIEDNGSSPARQKLQYSFSSLDESFQNGRNISGVFTPDLRNEIFYSTNRKFLNSRSLQQSDSELYKTAHRYDVANVTNSKSSPQNISQKVFHELIKERLHAIRAHEALLKHKEETLTALELKLNEKESKLRDLQQKLLKKQTILDNKIRNFQQVNRRKAKGLQTASAPTRRISLAASLDLSSPQDETYCTIEPQDTISPTVAKLNLNNLPSTKSLSNLRKVTFKSPKGLVSYDTENMPPSKAKLQNKTGNSICSSSDGSTSDSTNQRRKSLLSFLGIKRNVKETIVNNIPSKTSLKPSTHCQSKDILSECETEKLKNIWTKENKRAAFDLLAMMNVTEDSEAGKNKIPYMNARQSMRQSFRHSLQRERMRQSMRVFPKAVETK